MLQRGYGGDRVNKQEFNELSIESKIDYFNTKLNDGKTVTMIRKDIGIGEKSWQKEVKHNGYKFDIKLKNYIKVTEVTQIINSNDKSNSLVTNENISLGDKSNSLVVNENIDLDDKSNSLVVNDNIRLDDKSNPLVVNNDIGYEDNLNVVVTNEEYKRVIKELHDIKSMYSKFEDMYQWYELQKQVVEKAQLRIEANDNEIITRSFKVYGDVYRDFMEFCKDHKEYKVQQLVSLALKELVQKYN